MKVQILAGRSLRLGSRAKWAVQPTNVVATYCWQFWVSYLTFLSLTYPICKVGIIISPPHKVTVRLKLQSHKAAEHNSVNDPALACEPMPYGQLNLGADPRAGLSLLPWGLHIGGPFALWTKVLHPALPTAFVTCLCDALLRLGSQRSWVCLSVGFLGYFQSLSRTGKF